MNATLTNIDEIVPVNENDQACLEEIKAVLTRHNRLTRFGVTLLHGHFEVADDEVLLETCDLETRTLTIQPKRVDSETARHMIGTHFRLDIPTIVAACWVHCMPYSDEGGGRGHHRPHHNTGR